MKSNIHKKYCIYEPEDNAGGQRFIRSYKRWKKKYNNKKYRRKEKNK